MEEHYIGNVEAQVQSLAVPFFAHSYSDIKLQVQYPSSRNQIENHSTFTVRWKNYPIKLCNFKMFKTMEFISNHEWTGQLVSKSIFINK